MIAYANPVKSHSLRMCQAFLKGSGGELVTDGVYRGGPAVFYGVQRELLAAWKACLAAGDDYYYIDNGYFLSRWQGGDYYRITKNGLQHDGFGPSDGERFRRLGIKLKPWRPVADHKAPLIALQSDWWYELNGTTQDRWLYLVLRWMAQFHWPRAVIRSKKQAAEPINWDEVSAVVCHSSNVAVDALCEGVPAVCTHTLRGAGYTGARLSDWPALPRPDDRERWAAVLADNQWTIAEIEQGLAWSTVR